jgi:hypothetical protein
MLAETYSIDRDSDWRQYPGERELVELVDKFNHWFATGFRRRADPPVRLHLLVACITDRTP